MWGGHKGAKETGFKLGAVESKPIGNALRQLPPEDRAVLARAFYEGWTTERVAADLQISEAVVKARLHHALHALRLMVDDRTQ